MSRIEWTEETWNPVTGCHKISPGCARCYAERVAERFRGVPGHPYERGFDVTLRPDRLVQPARWKRPRTIFVCSMSDLFGAWVTDSYVDRVFASIDDAPHHRYQVLTKRPERMAEVLQSRYGEFPPSYLWAGVSVESNGYAGRADVLRTAPAAVKFLSLEPLLGLLPDLDLTGIDWVIAGGESGPGARPMAAGWARDIRDRCTTARPAIPFFFKQWGGVHKMKTGRTLDGRIWDQMPGGSYG